MKSEKVLYIYALEDKLKIGITTNPVNRITQLNYKYPNPVLIYTSEPFTDDSYEKERFVHNILSSRRLNGEWFSVKPDIAINIIKKICGTPGWITNKNTMFGDYGIPQI